MSVSDGQKVNASTVNAAFVSKTANSEVTGVIELNNTSDADSGASVENVQQAINETFDAVGMTGIDDSTRKTYSSNDVIANGDSHKVAIGKLDQAVGDILAAPYISGQATSTDNSVPKFMGTDGDEVEASGVTIDDSNNVAIPGNLTVTGDLTVNGSTVTVNVATLEIEDKNIVINDGGNDASAEGAGLTVERTATHGSLVFDSTKTSKWKAGLVGSEVELQTISGAQTVTNKTFGDAPIFSAISTPSTPGAGVKVYAKSDNKVYKVGTDGVESELGAGAGSGAGGKNYASSLYDGTSITGLNLYNDGALSVPTLGSGGTATGVTIALNSTTQLRGTSNQRLSKDGSNRMGCGMSFDFSLDRADHEGAKPVFIKFKYKSSSGYVANDLKLYVYDRDGATMLNVSSLNGTAGVGASTSTTMFTGWFYPNSSNNDYRLIFHISNTTAAAFDIDIIDLYVGPDTMAAGAIVADYGTEAWTVTNATATASVHAFRDGCKVKVIGKISFTGTASGTITLTIPSKYTASSTDYTAFTVPYNVGNHRAWDTSASFASDGATQLASTTSMTFGSANAGGTYSQGVAASASVPFTWASGDQITFDAEWIVSNWLASTTLSTTETMLQSVRVKASSSAATTLATGVITDIPFATESEDNMGVFDGTTFTAPRTGHYLFTVKAGWVFAAASTTGAYSIYLSNGAGTILQTLTQEGHTRVGTIVARGAGVLYLTRGSTVKVQGYQDSGGTRTRDTNPIHNTLEITELPNLSIFGTYGVFELLTASSSVKTPTGSGNYHTMTGNSFTLFPGTWRLTGQGSFLDSGTTPTWQVGLVFWAAANGADSSSAPAALSTVSGLTILSVDGGSNGGASHNVPNAGGRIPTTPIIVRCTSSCTVYLNSYSQQTTSANARISVYLNAERVQ